MVGERTLRMPLGDCGYRLLRDSSGNRIDVEIMPVGVSRKLLSEES